jgi:hypothetical protein
LTPCSLGALELAAGPVRSVITPTVYVGPPPDALPVADPVDPDDPEPLEDFDELLQPAAATTATPATANNLLTFLENTPNPHLFSVVVSVFGFN